METSHPRPQSNRRSLSPEQSAAIMVAVVAVAAAGLAWYFWPLSPPAPPAPHPAAATSTAASAPPAPPENYPLPAAQDAAHVLPKLDASDGEAADVIAAALGVKSLAGLFVPEDLVRHIVATVDSLPRKSYAQRMSPLQPTAGRLRTLGKDDDLRLAHDNAFRYTPWVKLIEQLDAKRAVSAYIQLYPLFQQAYVELGYPDGYFNNRLVHVIDHLLEAPAPREPVRLVIRHVLPEYADPELEAASAGHKIMFRMGSANAAIVKAKLRELREELVSRSPEK